MTGNRAPAFVGIDWGSTHRRACLLDDEGGLLARQHDDQGGMACKGRFEQALNDLLVGWPQVRAELPVVMAGMVGSAMGWQEVPYVDARTPLRALTAKRVAVRGAPPGRRWSIVPGLVWRGEGDRVDVMRGEETQLLGALQLLGSRGEEGCYVLPGTHSKWAWLRGGAVHRLQTWMTGELFALLRAHGSLAAAMHAAPHHAEPDPQAFARGVADAAEGGLSHLLFGARARVVTGAMPAAVAAAYVSGLLIGSEWHALGRDSVAGPVRVIGEPALAALHARCAAMLGHPVEVLDAQAVQLAAWRVLAATKEFA